MLTLKGHYFQSGLTPVHGKSIGPVPEIMRMLELEDVGNITQVKCEVYKNTVPCFTVFQIEKLLQWKTDFFCHFKHAYNLF